MYTIAQLLLIKEPWKIYLESIVIFATSEIEKAILLELPKMENKCIHVVKIESIYIHIIIIIITLSLKWNNQDCHNFYYFILYFCWKYDAKEELYKICWNYMAI